MTFVFSWLHTVVVIWNTSFANSFSSADSWVWPRLILSTASLTITETLYREVQLTVAFRANYIYFISTNYNCISPPTMNLHSGEFQTYNMSKTAFRCHYQHAMSVSDQCILHLIDILNGSSIFSLIDLGQAYYQFEFQNVSQLKTAFNTNGGQYCFKRLPFSLCTTPATFQSLIHMIFEDGVHMILHGWHYFHPAIIKLA